MELSGLLPIRKGAESARRAQPQGDLEWNDEVLYPERWAVEALVGLWEANRAEGEAYGECFARLGVPRYATLLDQVMNPAA